MSSQVLIVLVLTFLINLITTPFKTKEPLQMKRLFLSRKINDVYLTNDLLTYCINIFRVLRRTVCTAHRIYLRLVVLRHALYHVSMSTGLPASLQPCLSSCSHF